METPEPDVLPATGENILDELEDRLDELWVIYLGLLDEYTIAQEQIQKAMSSGYLSLAKAQSNAPFGRRYGQDWYDERMKATHRTLVTTTSAQDGKDGIERRLGNLKISIMLPASPDSSKEGSVEGPDSAPQAVEPVQQPSPPGTPEPEDSAEGIGSDQTEEIVKAHMTDPLKWFGILVPSELRKAQASFAALTGGSTASQATESTHTGSALAASATNAARGMRSVEAEIRQVRKALRKAEKAKHMAG